MKNLSKIIIIAISSLIFTSHYSVNAQSESYNCYELPGIGERHCIIIEKGTFNDSLVERNVSGILDNLNRANQTYEDFNTSELMQLEYVADLISARSEAELRLASNLHEGVPGSSVFERGENGYVCVGAGCFSALRIALGSFAGALEDVLRRTAEQERARKASAESAFRESQRQEALAARRARSAEAQREAQRQEAAIERAEEAERVQERRKAKTEGAIIVICILAAWIILAFRYKKDISYEFERKILLILSWLIITWGIIAFGNEFVIYLWFLGLPFCIWLGPSSISVPVRRWLLKFYGYEGDELELELEDWRRNRSRMLEAGKSSFLNQLNGNSDKSHLEGGSAKQSSDSRHRKVGFCQGWNVSSTSKSTHPLYKCGNCGHAGCSDSNCPNNSFSGTNCKMCNHRANFKT